MKNIFIILFLSCLTTFAYAPPLQHSRWTTNVDSAIISGNTLTNIPLAAITNFPSKLTDWSLHATNDYTSVLVFQSFTNQLGNAAFLSRTNWQATNSNLTAWQAHSTNQYVGSFLGNSTNQSAYAMTAFAPFNIVDPAEPDNFYLTVDTNGVFRFGGFQVDYSTGGIVGVDSTMTGESIVSYPVNTNDATNLKYVTNAITTAPYIRTNIGTVKGDLALWNGTNWIAIHAGNNNEVLTVDSTSTNGVKYALLTAVATNAIPNLNGIGTNTTFVGPLVQTNALSNVLSFRAGVTNTNYIYFTNGGTNNFAFHQYMKNLELWQNGAKIFAWQSDGNVLLPPLANDWDVNNHNLSYVGNISWDGFGAQLTPFFDSPYNKISLQGTGGDPIFTANIDTLSIDFPTTVTMNDLTVSSLTAGGISIGIGDLTTDGTITAGAGEFGDHVSGDQVTANTRLNIPLSLYEGMLILTNGTNFNSIDPAPNVLCYAGAASATNTLRPISGQFESTGQMTANGSIITVKRIDTNSANTINLNTPDGALIDGLTNLTLNINAAITLIPSLNFDGTQTNWYSLADAVGRGTNGQQLITDSSNNRVWQNAPIVYTGYTNIGNLATSLVININHVMPNTNYFPSVSFIGIAGALPFFTTRTTTNFTVNLSAGIAGGDNIAWTVNYNP